MFRFTPLVAGLAITLPAFILSHARADNLGAAQDFNAVIFHDFNAVGGDIQGRIAVGHNMSVSNYSVNDNNVTGLSPYSLIVGNNLSYNSGQVSHGLAGYGGALTGSPTVLDNPPSKQAQHLDTIPFDFAGFQTQAQAQSAHLSGLAATASSVFDTYSALILTGTDPDLNIFNVTADVWSASDRAITSVYKIYAPAGSTVVINISGLDISMHGGIELHNGIASSHILYNFYEADTVTFNGMAVLGSILAPDSNVFVHSGNLNGTLIAHNASFDNGAEIHSFPFTGDIPDTPTPVPEPATIALLALGTFAMLPRRR